MNDNLIQLFSEIEISNREEAYEFISSQLFSQGSAEALLLKHALYEREETGNIQIDEGVILPHIESELVNQSFVAIIQPKVRIKYWSSEIANIELLIVILLSPNESEEGKHKIIDFMRKLADEEFVDHLKTIKTI